jgi:hypothetical protein
MRDLKVGDESKLKTWQTVGITGRVEPFRQILAIKKTEVFALDAPPEAVSKRLDLGRPVSEVAGNRYHPMRTEELNVQGMHVPIVRERAEVTQGPALKIGDVVSLLL